MASEAAMVRLQVTARARVEERLQYGRGGEREMEAISKTAEAPKTEEAYQLRRCR